MPRKQLSWIQLTCLFLLICGVLAMEARQSMWNEHLGRDVGEFWIRTEKYLTFHLQGTEYPPFAMLYFLLLRWAEFTFPRGLREELRRRKLRAAGAAPGPAQPRRGTPGGHPLRRPHARGRIDRLVPL
jgi:hypothetical protein